MTARIGTPPFGQLPIDQVDQLVQAEAPSTVPADGHQDRGLDLLRMLLIRKQDTPSSAELYQHPIGTHARLEPGRRGHRSAIFCSRGGSVVTLLRISPYLR